MMWVKTRRRGGGLEQPNFWVSYSDLLAAMLMIFVLLLVVALFHFSDANRQKQSLLERQEQKLLSFHQTQQALIQKLESAFEGKDVRVDPDTGVLHVHSGILFGEDEAILRPEGRARLDIIFDTYFRVILDKAFVDSIKQIEIEGHTNSRGAYLYNLELSQQRALAVMTALLDRAGADRDKLESMVVAGGRSYSHLILDDRGEEDPVRSRRIEIKFRLKEAELFNEIYRDLAE